MHFYVYISKIMTRSSFLPSPAENGSTQPNSHCSSALSWVGAIAVCRNSDLAASGAGNGIVRLWAVESDAKRVQPLFNLPLVSSGKYIFVVSCQVYVCFLFVSL